METLIELARWASPTVGWPVIGDMLSHFLLLSLLATGGAITLTPAMHRLLVTEQSLLTDLQFTSSIAIAQAAPGPNILFVTVMGWQAAGPWGALATTVGIMLPSSILALTVGRYGFSRSDKTWVKAAREGLAPLVIGLMFAVAWILSEQWWSRPVVLAIVVVAAVVTALTRFSPLAQILIGATVGAVVGSAGGL